MPQLGHVPTRGDRRAPSEFKTTASGISLEFLENVFNVTEVPTTTSERDQRLYHAGIDGAVGTVPLDVAIHRRDGYRCISQVGAYIRPRLPMSAILLIVELFVCLLRGDSLQICARSKRAVTLLLVAATSRS